MPPFSLPSSRHDKARVFMSECVQVVASDAMVDANEELRNFVVDSVQASDSRPAAAGERLESPRSKSTSATNGRSTEGHSMSGRRSRAAAPQAQQPCTPGPWITSARLCSLPYDWCHRKVYNTSYADDNVRMAPKTCYLLPALMFTTIPNCHEFTGRRVP